MSIEIDIDDLYKHFKKHNSGINRNGVLWIKTLFETGKDVSYYKIIEDFSTEAVEILVLYFSDREEFELCVELKNIIKKHKKISLNGDS